jgi:hypothetical protein
LNVCDFFVKDSREEKTEVNSSYADEHLSGLFGIDFGKALLKLFDKHLDQLEINKS